MPLQIICNKDPQHGGILEITSNSKDKNLFINFIQNDQSISIFRLNFEEIIQIYNILREKHGDLTLNHTYNNIDSKFRFIYQNEYNKIGIVFLKGNYIFKGYLDNGKHLILYKYIDFLIDRIFSAIYSEDKKNREKISNDS